MDAPTKRRHQPGGANPTRRKVVEEPFHPAAPTPTAAAAPPSRLVGAIVEKGFSAAAPSSAPRPSVLPFPVARHRSHGPHWGPVAKGAGKDGAEEEDEMDMDETDYQPVAAAAAGPVRRKEKKGMDFSRWREFVGDAPPKRRQGKPVQANKQGEQNIDAGAVTSKVGAASAGGRELEGDSMQIDSGNAKGPPGAVISVSDVVSKKRMNQAESRVELVKTSEVSNSVLQGERMELDGGESSMEAEINAENMARLAGMSAGEIAEAQAEIINKMNPALVEILRRRGREKSGGTKGVDKDKGVGNSALQKAKRATAGDWLMANEHNGGSWKVWSERVERIRMSLDDNHDSVVLSCAKLINVMLSFEFNESYFESSERVTDHGKYICTAPVFRSKPDLEGGFLEGGFWKYNTKPSNILPQCGDDEEDKGDEKPTIQDDVVVSGQDVAAGFIRMGILPRICFLLEDDEKVLESYAKSWTSGALDKAVQRDSMAFTLVKHHLSGFVFQCSASSKTLRYKVVKSLLRCYTLKRHHEAMLKSFVLQGITQESERSSNELDRRFQILKDACEMNSSLLAEVQRLKASICQ
nr:unnamed protein product [Digitaria exilis]